jgi:hypothetical protein
MLIFWRSGRRTENTIRRVMPFRPLTYGQLFDGVKLRRRGAFRLLSPRYTKI